MKDIMTAPFMTEAVRTVTNMYNHGWDERNGGNVSIMLDESELRDYLDMSVIREIPTGFGAPSLDGRCFLVTGTGKYFKNVRYDPERNLGIIRVSDSGRTAQLLWGYSDGGKFTSELPAHLMSHAARLEINPANRVVMHCHPANLLAMTYIHSLDSREFTRTLWQMCTECIVVFPDGVNVLPWMLCGTNERRGDCRDDEDRAACRLVAARNIRLRRRPRRNVRADRNRRKGRRNLSQDRSPAPPEHNKRQRAETASRAFQCRAEKGIS